jgi:2-oxoacid:acceptor oxidoreductase gamma subunit (pyruvate/2-ketoisovalerate family)
MKEITIYGRGGQGAVTAAQILATAAFAEGYWPQTFPRFGGERRGAPVVAYVRVDNEPIVIRTKVYAPDVVVVMDFNLFKMLNPLGDIKAGGTAIINYPDHGQELPLSIIESVGSLFTVDATKIAHQIYGKTTIPITNVIILGAYCAAVKDISLESIHKALADFFPEETVALNRKAAQMGYKNLRGLR